VKPKELQWDGLSGPDDPLMKTGIISNLFLSGRARPPGIEKMPSRSNEVFSAVFYSNCQKYVPLPVKEAIILSANIGDM
jgi:hypothetical protein